MRLTTHQRQTIKTTIAEAVGEDAQVYLFGSRVDDSKRGGDVDLYVEVDTSISPLNLANLILHLQNKLLLPVDIVLKQRNRPLTPFQAVAQKYAVELSVPS